MRDRVRPASRPRACAPAWARDRALSLWGLRGAKLASSVSLGRRLGGESAGGLAAKASRAAAQQQRGEKGLGCGETRASLTPWSVRTPPIFSRDQGRAPLEPGRWANTSRTRYLLPKADWTSSTRTSPQASPWSRSGSPRPSRGRHHPGIVQQLHDEVGLAIVEAALDRRAHAGRHGRVDGVQVQLTCT